MSAGNATRTRNPLATGQTPRKTSGPTPRVVQYRPIAARPNTAIPPMGKVTPPTSHITPIRPRGGTP